MLHCGGGIIAAVAVLLTSPWGTGPLGTGRDDMRVPALRGWACEPRTLRRSRRLASRARGAQRRVNAQRILRPCPRVAPRRSQLRSGDKPQPHCGGGAPAAVEAAAVKLKELLSERANPKEWWHGAAAPRGNKLALAVDASKRLATARSAIVLRATSLRSSRRHAGSPVGGNTHAGLGLACRTCDGARPGLSTHGSLQLLLDRTTAGPQRSRPRLSLRAATSAAPQLSSRRRLPRLQIRGWRSEQRWTDSHHYLAAPAHGGLAGV